MAKSKKKAVKKSKAKTKKDKGFTVSPIGWEILRDRLDSLDEKLDHTVRKVNLLLERVLPVDPSPPTPAENNEHLDDPDVPKS